MIRDWRTGEPIHVQDEVYIIRWKDLILEDEFGITLEDWNTTVEQTAEHIRGWSEQGIAERISCMVDLLMPSLQTLWQGKDGELSFRWLPCRSLPGATVADHALTASAIVYCSSQRKAGQKN